MLYRKTILPICLFCLMEVFLNAVGLDEIADLSDFLISIKLQNSTEKIEYVVKLSSISNISND